MVCISGPDAMNETLDESRFYANLGFLPFDVWSVEIDCITSIGLNTVSLEFGHLLKPQMYFCQNLEMTVCSAASMW